MEKLLDKTFGVRLLGFVSNIQCSDAASEEERESLINYSKRLIQNQCVYGTDEEKEYLKNVGIYEEYSKPCLKTDDGIEFYRYLDSNNKTILYSCMKKPKDAEAVVKNEYFRMKINQDKRVYFVDLDKCLEYIIMNTPIYSRKDVENLIFKKSL
jgi:hypothetical protein